MAFQNPFFHTDQVVSCFSNDFTHVIILDLIRNPGFPVKTGIHVLCNGSSLEFTLHSVRGGNESSNEAVTYQYNVELLLLTTESLQATCIREMISIFRINLLISLPE